MIYSHDNDKIIPVRVRSGEKLDTIALKLKLNYSSLKKINMHLKQDYIPQNSSAMLNIPISRLNIFHSVYGGQRRVDSRY
jgi:hypothetical protein